MVVASYAEEAAKPAADTKAAPACFACTHCKVPQADAGKCKCGMDLAALKILSMKDGECVACACAKDCKCTVKEGETKCSCGKDVIRAKCPAAKPVEAAVKAEMAPAAKAVEAAPATK